MISGILRKFVVISVLLCSLGYFILELVKTTYHPKVEIIEFPKTIYLEVGDVRNQSFRIKNSGSGDLVIEKIVPSCGCIALSVNHLTIKPAATALINLKFSDVVGSGSRTYDIVMKTNDPANMTVLRSITAIVSDSVQVVFDGESFEAGFFKVLPFRVIGEPISPIKSYVVESDCQWLDIETEHANKEIVGRILVENDFPGGWFDVQLTVSLNNGSKVLEKTVAVSIVRESEKFKVSRPFFMTQMTAEDHTKSVKIEGLDPVIHDVKYVGSKFIRETVKISKNSVEINSDPALMKVGPAAGHLMVSSKLDHKVLFCYPIYVTF